MLCDNILGSYVKYLNTLSESWQNEHLRKQSQSSLLK